MKLDKKQVNVIKGVAIICIILFHVLPEFDISNGDYVRLLLFQGVGLFVIASGYGLYHSIQKSDSRSFLIRRLLSIYPAYILTMIAILLTAPIISSGNGIDDSSILTNLFLHITGTHILIKEYFYSISAVFWYIGLALQYILFTALTKKYQINTRVFFLGSLLSLALIFAVSFNVFDELNRTLRLGFLGVWLIPFLFGALLATSHRFEKYRLIYSTVGISGMILSFYFLTNQQFGLNPKETFIQTFSEILALTIPSLALWTCLAYLIKSSFKNTIIYRTIVQFGAVSFELFLVHWSFIAPVFSSNLSMLIKIALYIVLVGAATYLLSKINALIQIWLIKKNVNALQ